VEPQETVVLVAVAQKTWLVAQALLDRVMQEVQGATLVWLVVAALEQSAAMVMLAQAVMAVLVEQVLHPQLLGLL
jgi:hypothetical protein